MAEILGRLPADLAAAIVVAQHRGPQSSSVRLLSFLEVRSRLRVTEAYDKEAIQLGCVYVAPADYHLLVEPDFLSLSTEEAIRHSRPSIDVLFESAADVYGAHVVAVLLTGANRDGARGLARVKDKGGLTIVQDPESAVRREMPDAAIATGAVDHVLVLPEIAGQLVETCGRVGVVG